MGLLSIGAFARAARLSPKALRLYDELGLLTPARVDPVSGYRRYAPAQLERARLVAWLRRLGMPLARIRRVCELAEAPGAAGAAQEVRAFWAAVEAETAAGRDLATFLVDHLSGRDLLVSGVHGNDGVDKGDDDRYGDGAPGTAGGAAAAHGTPTGQAPGKEMPTGHGTSTGHGARGDGGPLPVIRYAALSDRGRVRESNQDTAYAGSRLLAVADGFGSGGGPASAAAVDVFKRLEAEVVAGPAGDLLNALEDAVAEAERAVRGVAVPSVNSADSPDPLAAAETGRDIGTTLTALLWTGSRLALVHLGDSRAYLLRDGGLFQITHDHSVVQAMIDEGRLSPEEAASHPQRSLLARALTGGPASSAATATARDATVRDGVGVRGARGTAAAEMRLHDARLGDRYLLCSDGLSAVVATAEVRRVLGSEPDPERAVRALVGLANEAGGPDNVSCVVADVVMPDDAR